MEWKLKKFNELTTTELYEILQQRVDVFIVEQECSYGDIDGKDLEAYHVFATDEGRVAAYARIVLPGVSFDEVSIERVLVNTLYRGEGLGQELLKNVIDYVKEEIGEKKMKISSQEYLLEFFMSIGFERVSEPYVENGSSRVDMIYSDKL